MNVCNRVCTSGGRLIELGWNKIEGVLKSAECRLLVPAFNATIGCYKADSSFNLFKEPFI